MDFSDFIIISDSYTICLIKPNFCLHWFVSHIMCYCGYYYRIILHHKSRCF